MDQLTKNVIGPAASLAEELQPLDIDALLRQAEVIRDAVQAKTVSARQVGELFCGLVTACGDINTAVRLFLSEGVPEICKDIDTRLAGVDEAVGKAEAELQKSETARAALAELVAQLSGQSLAAPLRIDIAGYPAVITSTNKVPRKINARLFPRFGLGSVLFIGDHQAVEVSPDGFVTPVRPGASKVNAVATSDTSVYKSLCIEVVPPRLRLAAAGALRLDSKGNIRLT